VVVCHLFGLEDGAGKSYEETAKLLGVSETTVKVRRRTAVAKLRSEDLRGLLQDSVPRTRTLGVIHSTTNE